jgi:hypothetical protein
LRLCILLQSVPHATEDPLSSLVPEKPTRNGTKPPASRSAKASAHPGGALSQGTVHADLATWLLATEMGSDGRVGAAERACQKLSGGLSRSISPAAAQALVARALHHARAEFPFFEGGLDAVLEVVDTLHDYRGMITGVAQRHQRSESAGTDARGQTEHVRRDPSWAQRVSRRFRQPAVAFFE